MLTWMGLFLINREIVRGPWPSSGNNGQPPSLWEEVMGDRTDGEEEGIGERRDQRQDGRRVKEGGE